MDPSLPIPPAAAPGPPLIELSGVEVVSSLVPSMTVVEGVDWTIRAGEYWVVGGLPDSGKSDLLATAAGLLRPGRGRHCLLGRATDGTHGDDLLRERLRIGLVFEGGGRLFPQLTVAENVALPWCYHHDCAPAEAEGRVASLLEGLGLGFLAQQSADRISRVWRQRVALARALILRPAVLFLDNPIVDLNARQVAWWLRLLAGLAAGHPLLEHQPVTLVVATDDLRPWPTQARQFAYLKQRRWQVIGGPEALFAPADPVLQELLASAVSAP